MSNQEFLKTLERMKEVHDSKSQDYADPNNPLSNFDVSEYGLHLFTSDRDKCFAWPIFTKLARLSTLLNSGNAPNNESIEDSFVDIANYVILWKCDFMGREKKNPLNKELFDLIVLMPDNQVDELLQFVLTLREARNKNFPQDKSHLDALKFMEEDHQKLGQMIRKGDWPDLREPKKSK